VPVPQLQGLTSSRAFYPRVTHTIETLPSWHPCAKIHGFFGRFSSVSA
jgi:hypothetical protein